MLYFTLYCIYHFYLESYIYVLVGLCWVVLCVVLCWVLGCVGLCWVVLGCVSCCVLCWMLGCVGYVYGRLWKWYVYAYYKYVRPSSVPFVVVLCPSVPSVRRPSRSSSSSVRPSVPSVRRPSRPSVVKLQIQGRMQIFEKTSRYESCSHGTRRIG